jgi:hypothetical protein
MMVKAFQNVGALSPVFENENTAFRVRVLRGPAAP